MGYPMTWQRLVNRNRISDDQTWTATMPVSVDNIKHEGQIYDAAKRNVQQANSRMHMLRHDLERFAADSVDERAVAEWIAEDTGINPEIVAVVIGKLFQR